MSFTCVHWIPPVISAHTGVTVKTNSMQKVFDPAPLVQMQSWFNFNVPTLMHFERMLYHHLHYCWHHLFWFLFYGFFSMKSCTDSLNF